MIIIVGVVVHQVLIPQSKLKTKTTYKLTDISIVKAKKCDSRSTI